MFRTIKHKPALAIVGLLALVIVFVIPVLAAPPDNDELMNATPIINLPYSEVLNTSEATASPEDPWPYCYYNQPQATVWYAFTPVESSVVTADTGGSSYSTVVAVYTGEPGALNFVDCESYNYPMTFLAQAGETYYIMIGDIRYNPYPSPEPGFGGRLEFTLAEAQPMAEFGFYPYDPSTYDSIYFHNWSNIPYCYWCDLTAQWDFGDGATSTEWSPNHQYAADGDYTVSLTVTTEYGQTASVTQEIQVRTFDVGIARFSVPNAARVGQTRSITVALRNTSYPVEVEVRLYKSTVNGWEWTGTLQQTVPVRAPNRTTPFRFSYTFSQEDAELGKINFRAEARIVNARDAYLADNEAISLRTKVSP